jgi:hypothetical protein
MRDYVFLCKYFNFSYTEVGEVNISALLNSFQMGYDKRVRPNYGGEFILFNSFVTAQQVHSATTLSITTFSITTLSIMTLSIMGLVTTLSIINDTQHRHSA